MSFKVEFTKKALKEFNSLSERDKVFVALFFDKLEEDPFSGSQNIKKLKNPFEGYRGRVGKFRVLFVLEKNKIITIYSVRHRKDVYR